MPPLKHHKNYHCRPPGLSKPWKYRTILLFGKRMTHYLFDSIYSNTVHPFTWMTFKPPLDLISSAGPQAKIVDTNTLKIIILKCTTMNYYSNYYKIPDIACRYLTCTNLSAILPNLKVHRWNQNSVGCWIPSLQGHAKVNITKLTCFLQPFGRKHQGSKLLYLGFYFVSDCISVLKAKHVCMQKTALFQCYCPKHSKSEYLFCKSAISPSHHTIG